MNESLSHFIDKLQSNGRYVFTREEALKSLSISANAFIKSKLRLERKKRIFSPKLGFFVIVPTEYQGVGFPPVSWFIDDLMKFMKSPYYVGLLSAASIHGSSHQAPQEFQIVVENALRPITAGALQIRFFQKKDFEESQLLNRKTETGKMQVSTIEETIFDLVRYQKFAGYLSHVATVVNEFADSIDETKLIAIAKRKSIELSLSQRVGFLIETLFGKKKVRKFAAWMEKQNSFPVPLLPGSSRKGAALSDSWNVLVNEQLEVDE